MQSFYHNSKFLLSCPNIKNAPTDEGVEVVFAGRSNAGKSSCINVLTGQKKLAKVSKTPGRTQHLVFFSLGDKKKIVDLPGYGYAKVPIAVKHKWHQNMGEYFANRKSLKGAILLMDIRHPFKDFDNLMIQWCLANNIEAHILLSKADKLGKNQINQTLFKVQRRLQDNNISISVFSSLKKQGLDILHNKLNKMFADEITH